MLTDIAGWLVTEDPHSAYQLIVLRGGFSTDDRKIPMAIHTVARVREALLAFDKLEFLDPAKLHGTDTAAMLLLMRWKELDPADFNRTPHARLFDPPEVTNHGELQVKLLATRDLDSALEQMDLLDPARRPVEFVRIFDAWTAANPASQPEISGWPAARRLAWRDLEALNPKNR
jgi:hypothetical protein